MKLLKSRKFAYLVLVVCVLGSVVGFGGGSLASERKNILRIFDEGVNPSFTVRFSMDAYLENCAGYARTMAEEFRLYVDREDENAAKVLELAETVADETDISKRREAYDALCAKVETLFTDFQGVSEAEGRLFSNAYQNFGGEVSKLKYDEYHVLAESFNRSREGLPASALCGLLQIDELDTFR